MSNITRIGSLRWRFIHAWQETSASTCPSSASTFADSRHTDNFANATWDAFALKQVKNVLFPAVFFRLLTRRLGPVLSQCQGGLNINLI